MSKFYQYLVGYSLDEFVFPDSEPPIINNL